MIVGVPREIKIAEYRVALTPEGVTEIVKNGHTVLIEKNALEQNPNLAKGLNTHAGKVTYKAVAEAHGYEYSPIF